MKILLPEDKDFPKSLLYIKNPPKKLWVEGNTKLLNQKAIAIIGSRDCTEYGVKWCEIFTKGLVKYNFIIVSGMAIGIDSVAHNSALKYGGKTIAVLPSGLNNVYPKTNYNLYKQIIQNGGVVISEYPPKTEGRKELFLERNRLVSGLGIATLVVEAEHRSGTSVTASITQRHGKKVFCIPGSLDNSKSVGTNVMIQKGAELVTCVEDIVSNYEVVDKKDYKPKLSKMEVQDIDEEYRDLYKIICDGPVTLNQLAKRARISVSEAMSKITMLEIDGKVERNEKSEICISKNKNAF